MKGRSFLGVWSVSIRKVQEGRWSIFPTCREESFGEQRFSGPFVVFSFMPFNYLLYCKRKKKARSIVLELYHLEKAVTVLSDIRILV